MKITNPFFSKSTLLLVWLSLLASTVCPANVVPFVKQYKDNGRQIRLQRVSISTNSEDLASEVKTLEEILRKKEIQVLGSARFEIELELTEVDFPESDSDYRDQIQSQGYRLTVREKNILIQAKSPAGVFYGIQTLAQLIKEEGRLQSVEILDWPDLALRMIMLDSGRQNENLDYYKRVLKFCGRYKINVLHMHLTDDQFSAFYHEEYPWIMHPRAMRPEQVSELVATAKRYHVNIMPEIESLGHCGLFERHPMMREILHQAPLDNFWHPFNSDIHVPGFVNALCPASELAYDYLDDMYARCAELFPYGVIHVGLDEVEMTGCDRCRNKFGEIVVR